MESHLGQSWALWLYFISFDWQSLLFGCIWKDGNLSTDSRPHDKSFSCYVTISCLVLCANESFNTYPGLPIKQVSMIILLGQGKESVLQIQKYGYLELQITNSVVWFRNTAIQKYIQTSGFPSIFSLIALKERPRCFLQTIVFPFSFSSSTCSSSSLL